VVRLKNTKSGAIVVVPDEKAERLGAEWEIVADEKPAVKRGPGRPKKQSE
jgi:hypothetical protein